MNRVFVLDDRKIPLMPCRSARARRLLAAGKAAVYRRVPFTIILKYEVDPDNQPVEFKVDPGSKTTGIALVGQFNRGNELLWGANLSHRGQSIKDKLESRRSLRRGRRNRKTRYRAARFLNRRKKTGWLPPSLQSRVDNVSSWLKKLRSRAPISECHVETVRFDLQKIVNPEISGIEYQKGELTGYEVREYLLEKWRRQCVYCDSKDTALEIEHIVPRSKGGSNRVSNLTISCRYCNQGKGNMPVEQFVKDPARLNRILAYAKAPLKDASAVNATRYAIGNAIKEFGLPTSFWTGGRTKLNRSKQHYAKDHYSDAACVGETGANVVISENPKPLLIKATGRGTRQTVRTDKFGFPRNAAGRVKRVFGFQTGDLVRLDLSKGKYAGTHVGRLAGIRANGRLDIATMAGRITASFKNFTIIQRGDGYAYTN
ncbi:RNA-guided endonuclease IscB [Methylicorpusculum oleiharenae]|uniref:RNA-guided endonuclease IscB n=1 Tax=Methylicorpusculum oleiharenae TaxID=1338687 RepID=UPI001356D45A|nr:RNA-guided endonuclease IscB [Methylicorpusculum oleiharenae]MCD2453585.1 RNA-guided endonuclease IscB [Methylicorpusculum oleiharenae]